MTERAATSVLTWFDLKLTNRICHRICERRIFSISAMSTWSAFSMSLAFYGGPAGSHILALLRESRMPIVVTLHTVLQEPRPDQRLVMQEMAAIAMVVMSERGRRMLQEPYQVPATKIDLILHGIPDIPFVDPNYFKGQFGDWGGCEFGQNVR
jgi:hypothetical protein